MEIQSNKSVHSIGIISKMIQTHSRTSCQRSLRHNKILTRTIHFMCTIHFFYKTSLPHDSICARDMCPCYATVSSTFILSEIYRNSKFVSHFTIILSSHKHKLRNTLFCSYNNTITLKLFDELTSLEIINSV